MRHFCTVALYCAAELAAASIPARATDYAGKTVKVIVNFGVGGSTDLDARMLVRHLPRFIPGYPTILVQNMPGAGGSVGANWLGEVAKPDGLTIGYLGGVANKAALQTKDIRADFRKLAFIGTVSGLNVTYVRKDILPKLDKPEDFLKADGFWIGGLSPDSNKDIRVRMQLDLLGLNYHYLSGYAGSADARLAFKRKEIQLYSEALGTYLMSIGPELVRGGEAIPLWYDPLFKDGMSYRSADTETIPAQPFDEFITRVKGSPPQGQLWDAYKLATKFSTTFLYLIMMPPATSGEDVKTIGSAIEQLSKDETYKAEARQASGTTPILATGKNTEEEFRDMLNPDPELKAFINAYIEKGQKDVGKR